MPDDVATGADLMHHAPMPILQIRDVPDDVYQRVTAAARAEHRSLSQQAVIALRRALDADVPDRRASVVRRLRASGRCLPAGAADPVSLVREDRDSR
jgi:hypothetical protein